MTDLAFGDVPEKPKRNSGGRAASPHWLAVADQLREAYDAGNEQFARVAETEKRNAASSLVARIRKGSLTAFTPEGSFAAEWRVLPDGDAQSGPFGVWARYVGDDVDPAEIFARNTPLAELRGLAQGRGLKVSGNPADLAARIVDYDNEKPTDEWTTGEK